VVLTQLELYSATGNDGEAGRAAADIWPFPAAARSGGNSVAVEASNAVLILEDTLLNAGPGGDGGLGYAAREGRPGNAGMRETDSAATLAGEGGDTTSCQVGGNGGAGGDGAAGGLLNENEAGDNGTGAGAGLGGLQEGNEERDGQDGEDAPDGPFGVGGGPLGYIRLGMWHPHAGLAGANGNAGGGGGGGASGVAIEELAGLAGGGGGSGGCGGEGAGGGGGGGGSIALYLENAEVVFGSGCTLQTEEGGDGGDSQAGGHGGQGGAAGQGGVIADAEDSDRNGGDGGEGGDGGDGGDGGAGAGGISVAMVIVGETMVTGEPNFVVASGGRSGQREGGALESQGAVGYAGPMLRFPVVDPEGDCPYGQATLLGALFGTGSTYCIDRFEASRNTAVPEQLVDDVSVDQALSLPGQTPWTNVTFNEAIVACGRNGGYPCPDIAIDAACGLGTPLEASGCNFSGELEPTGSAPRCVTDDEGRIADLMGNAAEWVFVSDLYRGDTLVTGGSYLDDGSDVECGDTASSEDKAPEVGFRCCYITSHYPDTEAP
jgi:hypothetical protein